MSANPSDRFRALRAVRAALVLVVLAIVATGCAGRRPVVVDTLRDRDPRVPVILIPGITGTELLDRESGRTVWGDGHSLLFPRDGGTSIALPLDPAHEPAATPGREIRRIRLLAGAIRFDVYGPVIETMAVNGYRIGDLDDPDAESTFFVFGYDWRRSAVEAAATLRERLEALRRARGESRLRVHLVCQSNAGQIARYLMKYGGAPLGDAESGRAGPPSTLTVDKLILVGTANGGSVRVLHEMNRGRRYVPVIGRKLRPDVLFTYPSLYEALPDYLDAPVVDEDGVALDVDLFDPEAWIDHRWSVFAPGALRDALSPSARHLFVDRTTIERHLATSLDRARRLHRVLLVDPPGFVAARVYSIQNAYRPTPDRVVVICPRSGPCRTRFATDRAVRRRRDLLARVTAPGDGHATLASQGRLSPAEIAGLAAPTFYVDDGHFEMILNRAALRRLLEFLDD